MEKQLHYIWRYASFCLNCGSLWTKEIGLCRRCAETLRARVNCQHFYSEDLSVSALFEWIPKESDLLSRYLLSLKGTKRKEAWEKIAFHFMRAKFDKQPMPGRCVVVPAPSSVPGQKDHAFLWAQALAQLLGAELVPCLRKVQKRRHQRGYGRDQRAEIHIELVENNSQVQEVGNTTRWIFADDILTTGATARAARKALGNPPHFEAWVLAHRKLSCGASKHLI